MESSRDIDKCLLEQLLIFETVGVSKVLIYDLVLYYYTVVGTILINDWIEANNRYLLLVWISISHVYVSHLEIVKVNKKLSARGHP